MFLCLSIYYLPLFPKSLLNTLSSIFSSRNVYTAGGNLDDTSMNLHHLSLKSQSLTKTFLTRKGNYSLLVFDKTTL